VVGKDFKAIHGPLIQQIELWTYRAVSAFVSDPIRQVFWFKLPFALCDLGVMAALWALLRAHGLPRDLVLIYAWSPLAIIEFWATGHNDSVVVLLITLALLAAARERWTGAFAALSLAVAAKIWPLLLFPIFMGWRRHRPLRWYQWWVALPVPGLIALPYWTNVTENMRFMSGFMGGWRNNDSLFGIILWLAKDPYLARYMAFWHHGWCGSGPHVVRCSARASLPGGHRGDAHGVSQLPSLVSHLVSAATGVGPRSGLVTVDGAGAAGLSFAVRGVGNG
jgi:hypothetical protein